MLLVMSFYSPWIAAAAGVAGMQHACMMSVVCGEVNCICVVLMSEVRRQGPRAQELLTHDEIRAVLVVHETSHT
jgi:hypothetical protein